jgi:hypothetical protein
VQDDQDAPEVRDTADFRPWAIAEFFEFHTPVRSTIRGLRGQMRQA